MTNGVKCPAHGIEMPVSNCVTRQKIVAEKPTSGHKATAYKIYLPHCGKCKTGLELYKKSLERGKEMVQTPMRECNDCGKHKAPTEEFFRKAGRGLSRTCLACEGDGRQIVEKPEQKPVTPTEEKKDAPLKVCKWQPCTKEVPHKEGEAPHVYASRLYCSPECAKLAEKKREAERKREKNRQLKAIMVFDKEKAEQIARDITGDILDFLSPWMKEGTVVDQDQVRQVAEKVGVECQKAALGAA